MPLSEAAPRRAVHRRTVECRGYEREDGLWDIEGHLVDTKSYPVPNRARGEIPAGEPIHGMWIRLTVDEQLHIHAAEAVTDHAPFAMCPDITERFRELGGLDIGPGFSRAVRQRLGGVRGCTHLVEMLRPIATTAIQTLVGARRRREEREGHKARPAILDTCHALASDSVVVREHWPDYYTGKAGG